MFPIQLLEQRINKLKTCMAKERINAVLISSLSSSICYTGVKWRGSFLYIPLNDDPIVYLPTSDEEGFAKRSWIKTSIRIPIMEDL